MKKIISFSAAFVLQYCVMFIISIVDINDNKPEDSDGISICVPTGKKAIGSFLQYNVNIA